MTLEQLRVFVAVAERQHVTRAAEALHLTQSAASAAIATLETRSGVRLFDRVGRGIELTGAGRAFLAEARAVLARAEAAETVLAELAGLARGTLPVHASQTIASYWLPRHLVAFRRAHPGITVPLSIGNTAQVAAAVAAGTAELGFVEGAVEDPHFIARTVAMDQLVVVVAPSHPWASRPPADLATLVREGEWVLREPGSGTRSAFEDSLHAAGLDPGALAVTLELPSNESVRGAVEAGLGATAISASVAAPSIEAGLLHRVPIALPERAFQVLWHRERPPSRAAEALLALLPAEAPFRRRRGAGSAPG
ncbi:LysR family transcriptional regulator [Roseomonas sp. SSH11]|uniref:LysR family transcriptional regulator n=1 Tax=Pararoseomonas baculiformis TaxID=2820812 RepID=A0ABS4A8L9_9PROT|nr:LysR substrate-binding domain-containing protein [Pararoseomonas baculiformis]MBP0443346.1 LysR family transcriptional regulator [Pararoseomonas baculiformis]